MNCIKCQYQIEYDEGEGNIEDGYTCFECLTKPNELTSQQEDFMIESGMEDIVGCNKYELGEI